MARMAMDCNLKNCNYGLFTSYIPRVTWDGVKVLFHHPRLASLARFSGFATACLYAETPNASPLAKMLACSPVEEERIYPAKKN